MQTALYVAMMSRDCAAVALQAGYSVEYDGKRNLFEAGRVIEERRNKEQRCTLMRLRYADGSTLKFTWSPARGPRYQVED